MTRIKICGLTRPCDIDAVNGERPDYIGFVFADSRRRVTPAQALELRGRLAEGIVPVGVFVDDTVDDVAALVEAGVIEIAQLHGSETEAYIRALKARIDKPVIKAVSFETLNNPEWARQDRKWQNTCADYLLFDSGPGGTGRSFDWGMIGRIGKPFFLAGGLHMGNVAAAIAAVQPFAVDISSSVETDGLKDREKIKEIIRRVRNA